MTNGEVYTNRLRQSVRAYKGLLEFAFALIPAVAVGYIFLFTDDNAVFRDYLAHELAIGLAVILSGFIALITWRCHLASREPFLRWLALGFAGFTLVYLPHGVLTRSADHNIWLFLLYGPAARLTMMACLTIGLLNMGRPVTPANPAQDRRFWMTGLVTFFVIDIAVGLLASFPMGGEPWVRISLESGALALMLVSVGILLWKQPGSPLLRIFLISLLVFAQSSVAFMLLAKAWDHQWWLAHTIFAAGFLLLSYGVVQAYLTSGSFVAVYSTEEMVNQLRQEKDRAEDALSRLEAANSKLHKLATTDALTGLGNRRHFTDQAERMLQRTRLDRLPCALLMLDLDHFKTINDTYGHATGDLMLNHFTALLSETLRPEDLCGRFGGEEFMVLLPNCLPSDARVVAERIRTKLESTPLIRGGETALSITTSIGIAHSGTDGDTLDALLKRADARLYAAKALGRNCVLDQDSAIADAT
ncbi:GGDEF domain-containing protein [Marinobacterium litorale]|uniref:GGDEF domain-containing protein n=1 Tax=Marinobacterium litorale TaxID=404770 RepID=UPI00048156B6|nr:GGDEF domain-containing protein [Marinobacterium litorale]